MPDQIDQLVAGEIPGEMIAEEKETESTDTDDSGKTESRRIHLEVGAGESDDDEQKRELLHPMGEGLHPQRSGFDDLPGEGFLEDEILESLEKVDALKAKIALAALRDAGGLRIDHVIGLFRLWWIPEGMKPYQGTYVRYDHEAMVGVLLWAERRYRLRHGRVLWLYVMLYTLGRVWIEYLRIDDAETVLGVRLNVWTSAVVFLLALYFFVKIGRRTRGQEEQIWLPGHEPEESDDADDTQERGATDEPEGTTPDVTDQFR